MEWIFIFSTGFYHDPVVASYYSNIYGQYYIYENGYYVLWTSDAVLTSSSGYSKFLDVSFSYR